MMKLPVFKYLRVFVTVSVIFLTLSIASQNIPAELYAEDDISPYINAPMTVDPPEGAISYWPSPVYIQWDGGLTELVGVDGRRLNENNMMSRLDLTYWRLTVNGEECDLSQRGDFDDFIIFHSQISDEQHGGDSLTDIWQVKFYPFTALTTPAPGDRTGTIRYPKTGTVEITLLPGAVYDIEGNTNPLTVITYYQYDILVSAMPRWNTETEETIFERGTGMLKVEWVDYKWTSDGQKTDEILGSYPVVRLNPNPIGRAYVTRTDIDSQGDNIVIDIHDSIEITDGILEVDISGLPAGQYDIVIPEGCVFFEGDKITNAAYFSFLIMDSEYHYTLEDLVYLVNYLSGQNSSGLDDRYVDIDRNGTVDEADLIALIEILLSLPISDSDMSDPQTGLNELNIGETEDLGSGLYNVPLEIVPSSLYTALQADILIPQGMEIESVSLGSVLENHTLSFANVDDNVARIVIYSTAMTPMPLNTTTVCADIRLRGLCGEESRMEIRNITVCDNEGVSYVIEPTFAYIGETLGVGEMQEDLIKPLAIYNLQGICLKKDVPKTDLRNLSPGIYIIDGKKITVK